MKKKIMIFLAVFAAIGVGLYAYMYKGHRDISTEDADFQVTVAALQKQFAQDGVKANKTYADKTVAVSGKVTAIDAASHTAVIDDHLSAVFTDSTLRGVTVQKQLKIKGRFVGYDDLLEEFKVDQASIEE